MDERQDETFGTRILCPHCNGEISMELKLIAAAMFVKQQPKHMQPRHERFSSYECTLLEHVEELGILGAFNNAVRQAKGTQTPKDLDRFFLQFIRTCQPVRVPPPTLTVLIERFGPAQIEVFATQSVVMITADREPVLFAPEVYARMSNSLKEKTGIRLDPPIAQLEEWIRTKNGYVAGRGLMWDELKGKSAGAFARPHI